MAKSDAEVGTVFEKTQIGVEVTSGTSVAATKILTASQITPGIKISTQAYRPSGYKSNTLIVKGKEWTEASLAGPLTYTEIIYWLASIFSAPAAAVNPANTPTATAFQWDFNITDSAPDIVKTYTIEQGSSARSKKFSYGALTSWGFTANRDSVQMTGSLLGQLMTDNVAMTSLTSAAEISLIPVLPQHVNLYIASTQAGLAAAVPLSRGFEYTFSLGSRQNPVWALDRSKSSYSGIIETPIDIKSSLMLEADSEGMALLTNMRANSTVFVRFEAIGAVIDTGTPGHSYTVRMDTAGQISDPGAYADKDGVLAMTWGMTGVHDTTWGKTASVMVKNLLATL